MKVLLDNNCKEKNNILYDDEFYKNRNRDTIYAADVVLTVINDIFSPTSMVDVGCGVGTWLNEFKKISRSCSEVAGIDGEYINEKYFVINKSEFYPQNLEDRILIHKRFDLAISLEVAEHLSKERAESFVDDLTQLSDVVCFSAAFKGQGGDGHINEQSMSYWKKKFEKRGYVAYDIIRPLIYSDMKISYWYRNNICIYVNVKKDIPQCLTKYTNWGGANIILEDVFQKYMRDLKGKIKDGGIKQKLRNLIKY